MAIPPLVALEIGTTKTIALVGELREGGNVMITGMGTHPSAGVRKGEIIDLENAMACVRSAFAVAEESGKVTIRQVHVALSGGHIRSLVNRGSVPVIDKDGEIVQDDIEQVMEVARAVNLPPERDIIHTVCQHFCIDDQERVIRPEGMEGTKLSLDMLVLHGVRTLLRNTVKVVRSIPMEVQDVAFSGLCSGLAVLTPEQKKSGVIVVDLGGGTTDYIAYANNVLAAAGTLGLGGDHVTNDIALAFNIPISQADRVKREAGSAVINVPNASQRIALPAEVGFQSRSLSLGSLNTVINARLDEMLGMIRKRLQQEMILPLIGAGIVLTGGGAHQKGVVQVAEEIFGLPCSIGKPRNVSGLATATEGPEYATCIGMVQYGFKTMLDHRQGAGLGAWIKGLFVK
jgi:cell division protein FtsA